MEIKKYNTIRNIKRWKQTVQKMVLEPKRRQIKVWNHSWWILPDYFSFDPNSACVWGFWMLLECRGHNGPAPSRSTLKQCEKPKLFFLIFWKFIMNEEKSINFRPLDHFFHGETAFWKKYGRIVPPAPA